MTENKELRELDLELPPCQTITLKDWNEGKVSLRKNLIAEFERPLKEEIQSLESSLDIKEAELSQSRFSKALDIDKARQEARTSERQKLGIDLEKAKSLARQECRKDVEKTFDEAYFCYWNIVRINSKLRHKEDMVKKFVEISHVFIELKNLILEGLDHLTESEAKEKK